MRIKSHWFKPGTEKGATEIAGAAGFIVFRIAQNALKRMRGAGYELPPGAPYFAFLAEFLAFLTLCADRIAHARGDEAWRVEFTTAMANKVGGYLADNQADLLARRLAGRLQEAVHRARQRALGRLRRVPVDRRGPRVRLRPLFRALRRRNHAGARPDVGDLAGHRMRGPGSGGPDARRDGGTAGSRAAPAVAGPGRGARRIAPWQRCARRHRP